MRKSVKQVIKSLLPPIVLSLIRKKGQIEFKGEYRNWQLALGDCKGYSDEGIVNKVLQSALAVAGGNGAYERDSVMFYKKEYCWSLLSGLFLSTIKGNGNLRVLDFGGSLGSAYFQHKNFISQVPGAIWAIVEQASFYRAGLDHLQDVQLKFFHSIDDCITEVQPNTAVFSAVLQYIQNPEDIISRLSKSSINLVIVDRTSFVPAGRNARIAVQYVDASIYKGSYPCHFFEEEQFIRWFINAGFKVIGEFDCTDQAGIPSYFKGFLFGRDGLY